MCDSLPTYQEAIAIARRSKGKKQPPKKTAKAPRKVTRRQEVDSESDCDCSDCCEESSSSCDCSDCEVESRTRRPIQRRQATKKQNNKTRNSCEDGSCNDNRRRAPPPQRKKPTNSCCGYSCR